MKKPTTFIFLLFVFISCQDNVTFNSPSFQGLKDNIFWRAVDSKATLSAGSITIEGFTSKEKVTLKTASINTGTYILGTGNANTATYILTDTNSTLTFSTSDARGNGEIVIEKYDAINNTISGTFKFNVKNENDGSSLNFQKGVFYKVPITN